MPSRYNTATVGNEISDDITKLFATAFALPAAKYRCIMTWSENVLLTPARAMQIRMDQVVSSVQLNDQFHKRVRPAPAAMFQYSTIPPLPAESGKTSTI